MAKKKKKLQFYLGDMTASAIQSNQEFSYPFQSDPFLDPNE